MTRADTDMLETRLPGVVAHARLAMIVGGGLTLVLLASAFVWPHAAVRAYLFGYVFWLNLAIGGLAWLMLGHVTGGAWGRTTRRSFEALAGTLPLLAVLGIPLWLGASHVYEWAMPDVAPADPVLAHRRPWMSPWVVGLRGAVCIGALIAFAVPLRRLSLRQDAATDPDTVLALGQRMRTISQGGCVVLFVVVELLAVDWIMALEPHGVSSIFGLLVLCGQAAGAMALVLLVLFDVEHHGKKPVAPPDRVHDLGKLLLASTILWAYMNYFQYLTQWMGQTQEDVRWYVRHLHGGWSWVAAALCVLHLGVPLLLLLSQPLKRSLRTLMPVAGLILAMRVVDVLWTVAPSAATGEAVGGVHWGDPVGLLGIGGLAGGLFAWNLSRVPIATKAYLTSGANVTGVVVEKGAARGV